MFAADSHNPIWRHDSSHRGTEENPVVGDSLQEELEADLDELQLLQMVKFLEIVVSSEVHR